MKKHWKSKNRQALPLYGQSGKCLPGAAMDTEINYRLLSKSLVLKRKKNFFESWQGGCNLQYIMIFKAISKYFINLKNIFRRRYLLIDGYLGDSYATNY